MKYSNSFDSTASLKDFLFQIAPGDDHGEIAVENSRLRLELPDGPDEYNRYIIGQYARPVGDVKAAVTIADHGLTPFNDYQAFALYISNEDRTRVDWVCVASSDDAATGIEIVGTSFTYNELTRDWEGAKHTIDNEFQPGDQFKLSRCGTHTRLCYTSGDEDIILHESDDFPEGPAKVALLLDTTTSQPLWVEFDEFRIELEPIYSAKLWEMLPDWLKFYPFEISSSGDLAMTPNGATCLLQDIADLLDTSPGEIVDHPAVGAGMPRFLGSVDSYSERARLAGQIKAALKSKGVGARIVPDTAVVTVTSKTESNLEVSIEVEAIDGEKIVPLNLVYRYGVDNVSSIHANSGFADGMSSDIQASDYIYPALGRDILLDRDAANQSMNPENWDQLFQWHLTQVSGSEMDMAKEHLRSITEYYLTIRAYGERLDSLAQTRGLTRLDYELDDDFRQRILDDWSSRTDDGTVKGIQNLGGLFGLNVNVLEGYLLGSFDLDPEQWSHWQQICPELIPGDSTSDYPWSQIFLDMTAIDGTVPVTEEYLYNLFYLRSRASRRLVYKNIEGDVRRFSKCDRWGRGNWNDHAVFTRDFEINISDATCND